MRSSIAFAVLIAVQALAGCEMPASHGETRDEHSAWRKVVSQVQDSRLRRQVEAGSFGRAQLFPGGMIQARHLPPLPRPHKVAIPAVPARVVQASPPEPRMQVALSSATDQAGGCVYKPVMSDADVEACR